MVKISMCVLIGTVWTAKVIQEQAEQWGAAGLVGKSWSIAKVQQRWVKNESCFMCCIKFCFCLSAIDMLTTLHFLICTSHAPAKLENAFDQCIDPFINLFICLIKIYWALAANHYSRHQIQNNKIYLKNTSSFSKIASFPTMASPSVLVTWGHLFSFSNMATSTWYPYGSWDTAPPWGLGVKIQARPPSANPRTVAPARTHVGKGACWPVAEVDLQRAKLQESIWRLWWCFSF